MTNLSSADGPAFVGSPETGGLRNREKNRNNNKNNKNNTGRKPSA